MMLSNFIPKESHPAIGVAIHQRILIGVVPSNEFLNTRNPKAFKRGSHVFYLLAGNLSRVQQ